MNITQDIRDRLGAAPTTLEQVRILLDEAHCPDVLYNKVSEAAHPVRDIALVQAFHGTDISRIRATTRAIEFNLQMTARPSAWVFVECQRSRDEAAFGWLEKYGIRYEFVEMDSASGGIPLKNPLWNIGASLCSETRLCFLDSDVVMCNSDWLDNVDRDFERGFDVLSLSSHQYYEDDERCYLLESVGYKWATTGRIGESHCGFTLGMTRRAFDMLGGFEPTLTLDDLHTFHRIVGNETFAPRRRWTNTFGLDGSGNTGLNVRLGYSDNVACHVWHGGTDGKYKAILELVDAAGVKSMTEILDYDPRHPFTLPKWREGDSRCGAMREVLAAYDDNLASLEPKNMDLPAEYFARMQKWFGKPDDSDHPLFVCTVVKDGFNLKAEDFFRFRTTVEEADFPTQPTVVAFTDAKLELEGMNVVPLRGYDPEDAIAQCKRRDVGFPRGAVVYYIPFSNEKFETRLWVPKAMVENRDGSAFFAR